MEYLCIRERLPEEILDEFGMWRPLPLEGLRCAGCRRIKVEASATPIDVPVEKVPRGHLVNTRGPCDAVSAQFERWIRGHVPDIAVGSVRRTTGELVPGYRTLRLPSRTWVLIRGGVGSIDQKDAYRRCAVCGRWRSFTWRLREPLNVLRGEARDEPVIYEEGDTIYLRSDLAADFRAQRFERLFLGDTVRVVDEPLEVIPGLDDAG